MLKAHENQFSSAKDCSTRKKDRLTYKHTEDQTRFSLRSTTANIRLASALFRVLVLQLFAIPFGNQLQTCLRHSQNHQFCYNVFFLEQFAWSHLLAGLERLKQMKQVQPAPCKSKTQKGTETQRNH